MTQLPPGSGIDWMIAAGVPDEEIERVLEKEKREKDILDHYERVMGYNPLGWDADKKLARLKRHLLGKTKEEITTFAEWSKRDYSSFTPSKARQYPEMVIDLWLQAFAPQADNSVRARLERERKQNG